MDQTVIIILISMFGFEPLRGAVRGHPFLKSGHCIFPDRYHNGTVFYTVLTHLQTRYQAYRGVAVCLAGRVRCIMPPTSKEGN